MVKKANLRGQILLFTIFRVITNTSYRMIYPYLLVFSTGVGVDLPTMTYAITARAMIGILGPLVAPIADARGYRTSMILGAGLYTFGALLVVVTPGYWSLFLTLVICAFGNYVFLAAMQGYIGDKIAYKRRGFVIAVTELSWSIAFIGGIPIIGYFIEHLGWQAPFPFFAAAGGLTVILLFFLLPGGKPGAKTNTGNHIFSHLVFVIKSPLAWAGLLIGICLSSANEMINMVFGVWMSDTFGVNIATLGAASAIIGISELGGEGLSGALTDRLGKEKSIAVGTIINALAAVSFLLLKGTLWGAMAGLFFFYLTFEFSIVSLLPFITELIPHARATLMAANLASFAVGRAIGGLLASYLYTGPGFPANIVGSVIFDFLALVALSRIRIPKVASGNPQT